jgi:cation diffusion facilitator family transporter
MGKIIKMKKQENIFDNKYIIGKKITLIGMLFNLFLCIVKITIGAMFGLLVLVANGFEHLFDISFLCVSFIAFKFSEKPADKEHPFGHSRVEYISTLILASLMIFLSINIFIESINKIISPSEVIVFNIFIILTLILSVLVKMGLAILYKVYYNKIKSLTLKATFFDSIFDVCSSVIILVSLIVSKFFNFYIDGYLSIIISILMFINGAKILKNVADLLIGTEPKIEIINKIKNKLKDFNEIKSIHDLTIHSYGERYTFASAHIMLDKATRLEDSNILIDKIIEDFKKDNINIVIQLEGENLTD